MYAWLLNVLPKLECLRRFKATWMASFGSETARLLQAVAPSRLSAFSPLDASSAVGLLSAELSLRTRRDSLLDIFLQHDQDLGSENH